MASDSIPSQAPIKRKVNPPPKDPTERERLAAIRSDLLEEIKANPLVNLKDLAKAKGVSYDTAYKVRREYEAGNPTGDRGETWGRLLSQAVPLRLRARVMRDLVKSSNPVAASRALEMVLESDGLRKKIAEPSRQASIVVKASDDVGFE